MKEDPLITVDDWDWCIDDPSRLEPWFSIRNDAEEKFLLYRDGVSAVFKTSDASGRSYYVRHDVPDSLAGHVKALFGSRAKDLYDASGILADHKIPCVQYPGWGKCGTESMILSEELPDAVTALEYWFRLVPHNHVLRLEFLSKLADLIGLLCSNALALREFSLRNILVRGNGSEMLVVDVSSVEERETLSREEKLVLLRPFAEMRGELSADDATVAILDSGLAADSQEASELWDDAVDNLEEYINNDLWPQVEETILAGESTPYCRIVPLENGGVLHVRNTIWNEELPVPDDTNSYAEELPGEDASKVWLNGIKALLARDHLQKLPLSWEHYEDDRKDVIRYEAESVAGLEE